MNEYKTPTEQYEEISIKGRNGYRWSKPIS